MSVSLFVVQGKKNTGGATYAVAPPGVKITDTVPASRAGWIPVGFNVFTIGDG